MFFKYEDINLDVEPDETMIDPKLASMYNYQVEIAPDFFVLHIPIPSNYDRSKLKITFNDDKTAVSIQAPKTVPVFKGSLYGPIKDYQTDYKDGDFAITMTMVKEQQWPVLIRNFYPDTTDIDPKSAYIIFQELSQCKETYNDSIMFLIKSSSLGFVPAMICIAQLDIGTGLAEQVDQGKKLFQIACQFYKDPYAMLVYAEVQIHTNAALAEEAIKLYRQAIELGCEEAHALLGRALSPLSSIKNPKRNAEEAVKELELGIKNNSPIAYHELAKLYYNGVGVQKNVKEANKLQEIALKLDPKVEPINDMTEKPKKMLIVFFVLFIALIIGLFLTK